MKFDGSGLGRLSERLAKLVDPDARPLMDSWMLIIERDNRQGVLAGTDKDGNPMIPVTYRPKNAAKLGKSQKNGARGTGRFAGFGPHAAGLHNNLSSTEYRRLTGPPLAPRGKFSRVITNLRVAWERFAESWVAFGYWDEVVSKKGVHFLPFHFDGEGHLPKRDLRGVRPGGREKAARAARAWAIDTVRSSA